MTTRGVFDDAQMGLALAANMGPSLQAYPLKSGIVQVTVSVTPAVVAAATVAEQTVAIAGVVTTDAVFVTPPGLTAGVGVIGARVSSTGTVSVQFCNPTAGTLTPASGIHIFNIYR